MHFLQNLSQDYYKENVHLGFIANEDTLFNPLSRIPSDYEDTPELYLAYLMQKPEYFSFFVKHVLTDASGLKGLLPIQSLILADMWKRKFPILLGSRGLGKTTLLALYVLLQCIFIPGRKVVVAGSGFRQSKLVFEHLEKMWEGSPILRSAFNTGKDGPRKGTDQYTFTVGSSVAKFVPLADGSTIRGLRANLLICVSKDTLVQTDKGLIEIQDYLNDDYLVMNGDNQFEKPTCIIKTEPTDVYKIETEYGLSFKCSNVHRVETDNGFKTAKDLTAEDYLLLDSNDFFPKEYQYLGTKLVDKRTAFIVGKYELSGIPSFILKSPRDVVVSFIAGVFSSSNTELEKSEKFCRQLQVLLLKLGTISSFSLQNNLFEFEFYGKYIKELIEQDFPYKCNISKVKVKSVTLLPDKEVLYDFHIPEKHSFIGNGFVQHNCDEFASVREDVFEQVLSGFAAVSSDPIANVKRRAYEKFQKKFDHIIKQIKVPWIPEETEETRGNQIIISGTADYEWNHFYRYFNNYRTIIKSKGDKRKLKTIFPEGVPDNFKWEQFAVYRIPVSLTQEGFMDDDAIARSKANILPHIYNMEYETIFSKDSQGFYPRSKIEQCTIKHDNSIDLGDGPIFFKAMMSGDPNAKYIYGLDSAAENDNLAIVIIELHPNHRRVVYCWTTKKDKFRERVKAGVERDQAFIPYVCEKIRKLMKVFPCAGLAIDAQGGGNHIAESLRDPALLNTQHGERILLEHIDPEKPKDTDGIPGDHIIHTIQFANSKWTSEANHGMKNDIENKTILFPFFDGVELALAFEKEEAVRQKMGLKTGISFDTYEDVIDEIEELKKELSNIVHSRTPNGTERWDTPEVKTGGKSVGHLKKDRYSALLMANSIASKFALLQHRPIETHFGGTLATLDRTKGNCYHGGVLADKLNDLYKNI